MSFVLVGDGGGECMSVGTVAFIFIVWLRPESEVDGRTGPLSLNDYGTGIAHTTGAPRGRGPHRAHMAVVVWLCACCACALCALCRVGLVLVCPSVPFCLSALGQRRLARLGREKWTGGQAGIRHRVRF